MVYIYACTQTYPTSQALPQRLSPVTEKPTTQPCPGQGGREQGAGKDEGRAGGRGGVCGRRGWGGEEGIRVGYADALG